MSNLDPRNVILTLDNRFLYSFMDAFRILKTKYGNDIEDMYTDIPALKELDDYIRIIWADLKPITMGDLLDEDSLLTKCPTEEETFAKKQSLLRWLPLSSIFADAEVVDEKTRITIQKDPIKSRDGTILYKETKIENIYRLKRKHVKDMFPEINEEMLNFKYVFAVQVFDVDNGKAYHLYVDHNQPFCKEGQYDAEAAVAWLVFTDIDPDSIEYITRQGEVLNFMHRVVPGSSIKRLPEPKHWTKELYFSKLRYQA